MPVRTYRSPAAAGLRRFRGGWLALLAATAISLYLCWLMLSRNVEVLLWATVLAIVFYPAHQRILRRTNRPTAAAILSCLLVVAVIVLPLTLLAVVIVEEAGEAGQYLQNNYVRLLDAGQPHMKFLGRFVNVERFRSPEGFREALGTLGAEVVGPTAGIVGNVLVKLLKMVFVVFTMFYLFRDAERVQETLRTMLPLDRAQSGQIFARTREVINASVHGVMVIAAIQGFMGGLAFWVLGLPSPLLWGSIMTLLSMIPLVGSTVVWIPTAVWLLITGQWVKALLLTLWGGVAISSVDNFLRPRLVGGKTRLHELLVFFSVIGGLQVFGILGIVIGPVLVAITLALLDVFRKADRPAVTMGQSALAAAPPRPRDVPPATSDAPPAPLVIDPPAPSAAIPADAPPRQPLPQGQPSTI